MNRFGFSASVLSVLVFVFLSLNVHADDSILDVTSTRDALYTDYDRVKKEILQRHGALNPDGSVNKNAPGYDAAVGEVKPHHDRMMERARELGARREGINRQIYEEAGVAKPTTSGTDPQRGGGRGIFGDAEGTAGSVRDYERIAKGFENRGYHVERHPDYIKVEKLDTVIHRPAGPADAVGSSAHEARVTAQTGGRETAGSAAGQRHYQGQGGQYADNDRMGAGLDSIKKIQDAVNEEPRTPFEKYQRDQVISKEANRLREAAGMGKDPHLERVKQGMDPDLIPEIKDPVKQNALDQARRAWPGIEEGNERNLADLDRAINNARTPEEGRRLIAERNDILSRQEGTKNAIIERDGGNAFREITGKEPVSAKPAVEPPAAGEKPPAEPGKTVKIGEEAPAGGKETVKVKGAQAQESAPGKGAGLFDNHPIERNLRPLFNGEPGKVTEFLGNNAGKITLVLTAAQTLSCLNQGKTVGECAIELVEGLGIGAGAVLVLGPTGATILGGAIGAYQIYEAGVEVTKQWADAQQRSAAYENRERQTEYNMGSLDRYVNDFREKKIYGELQASSLAASQACTMVVRDVLNAGNVTIEDSENFSRLNHLVTSIKSAAADCAASASLVSEITDLNSKIKGYEETVIKGLDWARAGADKCETREDANRIRAMYDNCTNLAAKIKGYSVLAREKNTKIVRIGEKGREAKVALGRARSMAVSTIGKEAVVAGIKGDVLSRIAGVTEKTNAHRALSRSILAEIDQLRQGFPDDLLPDNERKFVDLRGLVEKFAALTCEPDPAGWKRVLDNAEREMSGRAESARSAIEQADGELSACRGVATADHAVEEVDASANWVLTAVGMNEDLLRKADACLAGSRPQKELALASLHCSANSSPFWDDLKKEAQCRCDKGYLWNDSHSACVADRATLVAAADCVSGSEAYWNEALNKVDCRCKQGLKWNNDHSSCVADRDAQVATAKCWPGSKAYWDDTSKSVRCRCDKGYRWNDKKDACVVDKEAQLAAADCSHRPGSRPYWDEKENKPRCRWCNPGFRWKNAKSLECVADKAAQVATADCSGTPNSRPYWDDEYNEARCKYCNEGYHWRDSSGLECVADGGGNDGGGSINFGQIIQQISEANQRYQEERNRINDDWNRKQKELAERERASRLAESERQRRAEEARVKALRDAQDAAVRDRQRRQKEIEALRNRLAEWEEGLRCLEEGKRKYPNAWLNCNGNYTMRSRDVEIDHMRNLVNQGRTRLSRLTAGGM